MLRALGVRKIKLLTNNPAKRVGLKGYGLEIVESLALPIDTNPLRSDLTPSAHSSARPV
jgi:3,4-dihydroxy 2-butanone 4-phosphate synthase/GTP cyclohydrolase II